MATSGVARRLPVVVILGVTGAGKSKLALELAAKFNGEIISTDSMQIYKKLDIVTNKVTTAEMQICPHHMIDFLNPLTTGYTVTQYRDTALPIIDNILARGNIPFLVGGTSYYIEALLWESLIDVQGNTISPGGSHSVNETLEDTESLEHSLNMPSKKLKTGRSVFESHTTTPAGDSAPPERYVETVSEDLILARDDYDEEKMKTFPTRELYKILQNVDQERAQRIHPNDRRKILRSIQVFYRDGRKMSEILREQHVGGGSEEVRGPLRYHNPCIIWVQCQQQVLDERTDLRVDGMIERGLIHELTEFHTQYNADRLNKSEVPDYTHGIFQSIGFKEFHDYLILPEEDRVTEHGKTLLVQGIEAMKLRTRQYARKQTRRMTGRYLKKRGVDIPPVYRVDSTDKSKWKETVFEPASDILNSFIQGTEPPYSPLPTEDVDNLHEFNVCDVCEITFITLKEWHKHIQSRKHKNRLRRHKAMTTIQKEVTDTKSQSTSLNDVT